MQMSHCHVITYKTNETIAKITYKLKISLFLIVYEKGI